MPDTSIHDPATDDNAAHVPLLLTAALAYARRGWPVFPLHHPVNDRCSCGKAECGNVGKHPRYHDADLQHGLKDATTDLETIQRWWSRWPEANIGVVTGAISGLVVLDIDPRHGGHLILEDLEAEYGKLPHTVESQTGGGGRHILFQHPGGRVRSGSDKLGPGLDLKADGGYIVVPPSLHASGQRYEWEVSSTPKRTPLVPVPAWFPLYDPHTSHVTDDQADADASGTHETFHAEGSAGDDYNRRVEQGAVRVKLERHGWRVVERRGGVDYLCRPGKEGRGWSATLGHVAPRVLYVFTSSAPPFTANHAYTPFSILGLLEHDGDFKKAAKSLAEYGYGQRPQKARQAGESDSGADPEGEIDDGVGEVKPTIYLSTDTTSIVNHMQDSIQALPDGPYLFQRARQLSIIARGTTAPKWLRRPPAAPVIIPAEPAYMRELATQAATWKKYDRRGKTWEPTLPPLWAIDTLSARPTWPFPPLEGIVCAPTLRPDGSILTTPGYDHETGLYLDLNGTSYPPLRDHPTLDDARTAIGKLQEVYRDFPFAAPHHFSTVLAATCSLIARYAIQGKVPLFAMRSTTRGAGKGLLVDAITTLATGRQAPRWAQTLDEEEERKRLLTIAVAGDTAVHIDNVTRPLGSGPLDLALTAPTFSDRILGKQVSREAPMDVVFFASGNNMQFQGDTARRVVPIDLEPQEERPEEREGFAHSPLLPWVLKERPALVVAALTLLKAYFTAGCPPQGIKPLGSFEAWSVLIRQALIWAGEADPCAGRQDIEADSDPEFEAFNRVVATWYSCYGPQAKTVKQVVDDIDRHTKSALVSSDWHDLQDAVGTLDPNYPSRGLNTKLIGLALRAWRGRMVGGKRLVKVRTDRNGVVEWRVEMLHSCI